MGKLSRWRRSLITYEIDRPLQSPEYEGGCEIEVLGQLIKSRFATMIRYGLEFDYGDSDHIDRRVRRGILGQFW